jgi:hypothetical protein
MYKLPHNIDVRQTSEIELATAYWHGADDGDWAGMLGSIERGYDVGLLAANSGLVILDCDVKEYASDGFVVSGPRGSRARLEPTVVKCGIDDLIRVVRELGHEPSELATYTVRTKSGGFHLYFYACESVPLTTKHHRDEWRVDVIASENSWVAAPPTAGYDVVRDLAVMPLPVWLAEFLLYVNERLQPLGKRSDEALSEAAKQALREMTDLRQVADESGLRGVARQWLLLELDRIVIANRYGGWNQAIYQATLNLLDGGIAAEPATALVLEAATPWDEREKRVASDTIRSAVRRHGAKTFQARRETQFAQNLQQRGGE